MEQLANFTLGIDLLIGIILLSILRYIIFPFEYVITKYTGDSERPFFAKFEILLFSGLLAIVKITSYLIVLVIFIYPSTLDIVTASIREEGELTQDNGTYYVKGEEIKYTFIQPNIEKYINQSVYFNKRTKTVAFIDTDTNTQKPQATQKDTGGKASSEGEGEK